MAYNPRLMGTTTTGLQMSDETIAEPDEVTLYRAGQFIELGFGYDDAFSLADAKGKHGFKLYWGDVAKMLKSGATHPQIVSIFT